MKRALILIYLFAALLSTASANGKAHEIMQKSAKTYIAEFQAGIEFHRGDSISALIRDGKIDNLSLSTLAKELNSGNNDVRENIVRLLETVGLALDSNDTSKVSVIRDRAIIKTLLIEGFAKEDNARQLADSILRNRCTPSDLAAFNDIYVTSLKAKSGKYLYIVAKAKTTEAQPYVNELAMLPEWSGAARRRRMIEITLAALGDTRLENQFINTVREAERNAPPAPATLYSDGTGAKDGKQIARALPTLGLIGTTGTLSVACEYLRSPLKSYVVNVLETSVRIPALAAIQYNFPDERILENPHKLADWQAVERFCTDRIGVKFDGPTPNIAPDAVYSIGD